MAALLNRAKAYTATTGTGSMTLAGAVAPYQTWAAAGAVDNMIYSYLIEDTGGAWEIGTGIYVSGTLSRSMTQSSTGSLLNLSGSATAACVARKSDLGPYEAKDSGALPRAASFTTTNFSAGTALTDYDLGVRLEIPTTQSGFAFCYVNVPTAPFSVYMRHRTICRMMQFASSALIARNSTSGRCLIASVGSRGNEGVVTANNVWQTAIMFERFTSLSAFSASTAVTPGSRRDVPTWLRFDVTGGGVTLYDSVDGAGWWNNGSELVATFLNAAGGTLDQIGFGVQPGSTAAAAMFVNAFSFTAPQV